MLLRSPGALMLHSATDNCMDTHFTCVASGPYLIFSKKLSLFSSVQSLSHVGLFATPWTVSCQASLSITNSWSSLKLISFESVMPSNHVILCHPLLLPPSIFPSIRVFSNESVFHIRWPKYWSFSFSISPSNEYSGLSSFRPYSNYIIYLYFHFPMRLVLFRSHFTDKKIKTRED